MVQVYCIEEFSYLDCRLNTVTINVDKIYNASVVDEYYLIIEGYTFYLGDYPQFISTGKHRVGFEQSVDFYKYFNYLSDVRNELIDIYLV